jgi:hypothetical protein
MEFADCNRQYTSLSSAGERLQGYKHSNDCSNGFRFSQLRMNRDEIHKVITDFLALLKSGNESAEAREENLKLALECLALAYHFSDCKFDEANYPDAPKDYGSWRKVVSVLLA